MAFFSEFRSKVGGIAQKAAKKSAKMVELKRINTTVLSEEKSINNLYCQIGKHCFEKFRNDQENDETICELCQKIEIHRENIRYFKRKINALKNIFVCPNCESKIEKDSVYCKKCGAKLDLTETEAIMPNETDNEIGDETGNEIGDETGKEIGDETGKVETDKEQKVSEQQSNELK